MNHLILTYGYWAVFLLVGVESLGVPLPGETALILAGTYAGHSHRLSVWTLFLVASTAAILGDNIGYLIGRLGGFRVVARYGTRFHIDETKLKVGRYLFDRHGAKVVFLGRFVSVLRTYAAFLAGTNHMRWRRFFAANASGGIVWSAIFCFASYGAGNTMRRVSGMITVVIGGVAVAVIIGVILVMRQKSGVLSERAEAAFPGPLKSRASASEKHSRRSSTS